MIEIKVYNLDGGEIGTMSIDPALLGGEVRPALLKQAMVRYHANQRQGTRRTKRRAEVEGSTRKLYKQKGTGNARTGGIRNPIKVGGGHAKQRLPKDWSLDMPKKQRRLANRNALLVKLLSNEVKVVDKIALDQPKTKLMANMIAKLGLDRTVVLALDDQNDDIVRAGRNLPKLTLSNIARLNAWEMLRHRHILISQAGLQAFIDRGVEQTQAAAS